MPKSTKVTKKDGVIYRQKVPTRLRIGTRKSGKSAISMSNDDLRSVLESANQRKWHQNARTVLAARGA